MTGLLAVHRRTTFILLSLVLTLGCTSLSTQVLHLLDREQYDQARALLEKEGIGERIRPGVKPEALDARNRFTSKIEDVYLEKASGLYNEGLPRAALSAIDEGLLLAPWSKQMASEKMKYAQRLVEIDRLAAKWKDTSASGRLDAAEARAFLADLKELHPPYADTPVLLSLQGIAVNAIAAEWEKRFAEHEGLLGKGADVKFRDDMDLTRLTTVPNDRCIRWIWAHSAVDTRPGRFSVGTYRDLLIEGASCIDETKHNDASAASRLTKTAQGRVSHWYDEDLPLLSAKDDDSFETIDAYESLLENLSTHASQQLKRQIGSKHLRAAERRSGSGAASVLSLLHAARSEMLAGDKGSFQQVLAVRDSAVSGILAGERLGATMSIDSDPAISPQLYDLVRTAIMTGVRKKTRGFFSWRFLPEGRSGGDVNIMLEVIRLEIPSYDGLDTVVSQYLSHFESVPNPLKSYLEGMLSMAKLQLSFAESSYNMAVSTHNIYPTQYSLANANNAYNTYIDKLNYHNQLVREYNATSSTVERPVYKAYAFKQGTVRYGWELRMRLKTRDREITASGRSMETDFVRIGTRYNDTDPSRRRDDDLNFEVSIERTIAHLVAANLKVFDQVSPAILDAVPLQYTAGFSEREKKTAQWFLHPWGSDPEVARANGVPDWSIKALPTIKFSEFRPKPLEIVLPAPRERPGTPLDAKAAAKWYAGLVGEIFTKSKGEGRSISSGAVISPDGLILTCAHGIEGEELRVEFAVGPLKGAYAAEVVFVNDDYDVALIRAKRLASKRWLEIRLNGNPVKGEDIVAIGNPSLPDGSQSIEAISKGIVSNPESDVYGVPRTIADITVASGSSGGPLISLADGKIVGVVVAVADAQLAQSPGQRAASGTVCMAAPSSRLTDWLGIRGHRAAAGAQSMAPILWISPGQLTSGYLGVGLVTGGGSSKNNLASQNYQ